MRTTRFWWKLYAGYVLLIVLTAATVGILVDRTAQSEALSDIARELRGQAVLVGDVARQAWETGGDPSLQGRVRELGRRIGSRITVIRADGTVIADSQNDPGEMDDHSRRPEIASARAMGEGQEQRWSDTVRKMMLYLALRQGPAEAPVGYVRVAYALSHLDQRLGRLRRNVVYGALIAALFALALGFVVARRVTRPLAEMARATADLAENVYDRRVEVTTRDEFGQLGRHFNRMADALRERMHTMSEDRNKLRAIVHSMVEGLVAVDCDERIVHMNRAAGSLLDIRDPEVEGRPLREATRLHRVAELLARSMRENRTLRSELDLRSRGRARVVEVHASPLKDGEGRTVGAVVVLHDLTALRHLERVRSDFVANVSHELKTPVTAIRGLVETLLDDPEADGRTRERFLGKIQRQTDRLSSLVQDLLTLSRLEAGEESLNLVPLDIRGTLRDSFQSLLTHAESKQIEMEDDLGGQPVYIMGDHEAMRQIADNLLSNAINYTASGGRVRVGAYADGEAAVLEVEDTGVGIEPSHLERIFERFYRIDRARSRSQGGTGLGLSIVKHRVQSLSGEISVDSTPGVGTTFKVSFPLVSPQGRDAAHARGA